MSEDNPPDYTSLLHHNECYFGDLQPRINRPPEYTPPPKYSSAFQYPIVSKLSQKPESQNKPEKPLLIEMLDQLSCLNQLESLVNQLDRLNDLESLLHNTLPV